MKVKIKVKIRYNDKIFVLFCYNYTWFFPTSFGGNTGSLGVGGDRNSQPTHSVRINHGLNTIGMCNLCDTYLIYIGTNRLHELHSIHPA